MKTRLPVAPYHHQLNSDQRGYTLVETLTSLLIASIAVAGLSTAVTIAIRTGANASYLGTITMAQHSAFSHLRSYFSSLNTTPDSYQFRTDTIDTSSDQTYIDDEISKLVYDLRSSLNEVESTIDCQGNDTFTCEVCFEWYEHKQTYRSLIDHHSQNAVNRTACQLQIV